MFTKEQVLTLIRDNGGSVDWHPFVETGTMGIISDLERQGLVRRSNYDGGGGVLISLTDEGCKWIEENPGKPTCVVVNGSETAGQ